MSDAPAPLVRVDLPALAVNGPIDSVALVTLDRPRVLNALSFELIAQLADALETLDAGNACRVAVITGAGRAFAAGADIRELAIQTPDGLEADVVAGHGFHHWDRLAKIRIPLIAAVNGLALGGGCELAMTCDLIVAGESAQFGQPEIKLGIIPGSGGTQRLARAVGKAKAMEMILTGQPIGAREAEARGLVSTVVADDQVVEAALELAGRIASLSPLAVAAAKQAVLAAQELSLAAGLVRERGLFFRLFGSDDQQEGMAAFIEKRQPAWKGS